MKRSTNAGPRGRGRGDHPDEEALIQEARAKGNFVKPEHKPGLHGHEKEEPHDRELHQKGYGANQKKEQGDRKQPWQNRSIGAERAEGATHMPFNS